LKHSFEILSTDPGMPIDSRDEQDENADSPKSDHLDSRANLTDTTEREKA
jgi:hypothetical protein